VGGATRGLAVAAASCPADVVGGDAFDVEVLGDRVVRVLVADAIGHGVQAALRTMILFEAWNPAGEAFAVGSVIESLASPAPRPVS
jgi:hypothetical protein